MARLNFVLYFSIYFRGIVRVLDSTQFRIRKFYAFFTAHMADWVNAAVVRHMGNFTLQLNFYALRGISK
jgi:hypothetical protein